MTSTSTPCSTCGEQPEHPSHGGRRNSHAYDVPRQVAVDRAATVDGGKVLGSDLPSGAVVYLAGRWQVIDVVSRSSDSFRFTTDRTPVGMSGTARAASLYDVVVCAGCGQPITVTHDGDGDLYSECGGIGEGSCDVLLNGTDHCRDAAISHRTALRLATGR